MKKADLLVLVHKELNRIKAKATPKEIGRLDLSTFNHNLVDACIYGQMTGYCLSNRAKRLMPKKFDRIPKEKNYFGKRYYKFIDQDYTKGSEFTALEKYLYMSSKATHKKIIKFLKGETDSIILK